MNMDCHENSESHKDYIDTTVHGSHC